MSERVSSIFQRVLLVWLDRIILDVFFNWCLNELLLDLLVMAFTVLCTLVFYCVVYSALDSLAHVYLFSLFMVFSDSLYSIHI